MKKVHLLPNLLTLANAFCGLLAICKGIDALALTENVPGSFHAKMETACWLIFLAMVFDALDGKVARLTGGTSNFGAQLDSLSDMLTFGVAPAVLAKVLIEHEAPFYDYLGNPRVHFVAAATFSSMAILRLARFNLENEEGEEAHREFRGLPSPAAAGAVVATMLLYLSLRYPSLEVSDGTPTPFGEGLAQVPWLAESPRLVAFLPALTLMLVATGLLMVSRVRFTHMVTALAGRGQFFTLVAIVFAAFALFVAPVLAVFAVFVGYVLFGLVHAPLSDWWTRRKLSRATSLRAPAGAPEGLARAAIALGSNLGRRDRHLAYALRALRRIPGTRVLARSEWIETDPVGGPPGQPPFLNGIAVIQTPLAPRALLQRLQRIERDRGRRREQETGRDGPRTLDLDLLLYGDRAVREEGLEVPHPRMEEREFVLAPLAELAPNLVLPRSRKTVRARLAELRGTGAGGTGGTGGSGERGSGSRGAALPGAGTRG